MKITSQLDYQVILANRARPVYLAVNFEAPLVGKTRPRPIAFCLVLDRSGSMSGEPLAKAKQAALLAVRNLRPEDHFGMVVFDQEAQVLIPLQTSTKKDAFVGIIEAIHSGGNTNLTGGWMLGRDEVRKSPDAASRRLLLLSDGQLNHGIVDPETIRQIVVAGLQEHKVRTSCLGFGPAYNEDVMTQIAQVSGGQFYDADNAERFPAIFEAELDGLQKLTVQNLRMRLKKLDFCDSLTPLGRYPSVERPDGWTEFSVGDLVSGESRVVCFELGVMPLPWVDGQPVVSLEGEELLALELLYDEIGEQEISSRTETQIMRIQATQNPEDSKQTVEVIPWVALQKAGEVIEKVTALMDGQRIDEAVKALTDAITSLKSYGPQGSVMEAIQQLERVLARIKDEGWSGLLRKNLLYNRLSMAKMSSSEFWSAAEPAPSFKMPQKPQPPVPPQDPNVPPADLTTP